MNRIPHLRPLAHGVVAGFLLSCLRAPLGIDWTQVPAVDGVTASGFRAAALLAIAVGLPAGREGLRGGLGGLWFAGLLLGFGGHAFAAPPFLEPAGRAGMVTWLVLGTLALHFLAGARRAEAVPKGEDPARPERLGLVLVGSGVALALEALAHEVRLLAPIPDGESVIATTFLLMLLAAAVSFGPLLRRVGSEALRCAFGSALTAGSTLAGMVFLALMSPEGLHAYLRRLDASTAWVRTIDAGLGSPLGLESVPPLGAGSIGTLWATGLLAAAAMVIPAFVLGGALGATRSIGRVRHLLVGAAVGLLVEPHLVRALARPLEGSAIHSASWGWAWALTGATVAGLGVLAVSLGTRQRIGIVLAAVAAAVPWIRPNLALWSFSPWSVAPVAPDLVFQTTAGMVTLENARDGSPIVTLDRRRMTPIGEEADLDRRRIVESWRLLPEAVRAGPVRALFVGQMTPRRSRDLAALGTLRLDRTAPWDEAVEAVEERLFAGEGAPIGERVRPSLARARLAAGEYDWVLVPPVHGAIVHWRSEAREVWGSAEAARIDRLRLESGLGVAWVMADSPVARVGPGGRVLLAMSHFEKLALGWVSGKVDEKTTSILFPFGDRSDPPGRLEALRTLPQIRSLTLESGTARRLASATSARVDDPVRSGLAEGLLHHLAAQVFSSPFETRAQQIEIDEPALRAFSRAALASQAMDPFQRELWEGLAWLTIEKRLPEEALVYLEPVAERFQPWPELDLAVGNAYLEVLEPEEALRLFERASEHRQDLDLMNRMALVAQELGQEERARGYWRRGLEIQPGRQDFTRSYGLSLSRSDDPGARAFLADYLKRFPEDEEVRRILAGAR